MRARVTDVRVEAFEMGAPEPGRIDRKASHLLDQNLESGAAPPDHR